MARARSGDPIWARPEPGARRPRHTRQQIAAAALGIADTEGFEAVSMRRVATELGAGTMTLYHYVRTKADLLALMDDTIMGEVLVPADELPDDWRDALRLIATRSRNAFKRHPWALEGMRGAQPGPNGMRHFEQSLRAVSTIDLPLADRLNIVLIVDDFVFGTIVRDQESRIAHSRDEAARNEAISLFTTYITEQLATGEFPHLASLVEDGDPAATWLKLMESPVFERRFEHGLELLLDGVRADLQRRGALPPEAAAAD